MQRILKIKKRFLFAWLLNLSTSFMYNVGLINDTHQHTRAGTQEVSKTNGWSS